MQGSRDELGQSPVSDQEDDSSEEALASGAAQLSQAGTPGPLGHPDPLAGCREGRRDVCVCLCRGVCIYVGDIWSPGGSMTIPMKQDKVHVYEFITEQVLLLTNMRQGLGLGSSILRNSKQDM